MSKKIIQNKWWKDNVSKRKDEFNSWLGDLNSIDRIVARERIKAMGHRSVLDCACGFAIEYYGFKHDNIKIDYTGMDSTEFIVKDCQSRNINVVQGSIEDSPFGDSIFDVVYARHILEHLSGYEVALNQLIRCAKHEVIINFFLVPTKEPADLKTDVNLNNEVYVNRYCSTDIENSLRDNNKVKGFEWKDVNGYSLLFVLLK